MPEIPFETSGQSGLPVRWWRTPAQMDRELESVLGFPDVRFDRVLSFAPCTHLYGYLWADLLPRRAHVPVIEAWRDPFSIPRYDAGDRALVVCIPSAWQLVKRMLSRTTSADGMLVLHSAGILPDNAVEIVNELAAKGGRTLEILGSTECGAMAGRNPAKGTAWTCFHDVELLVRGDGVQPLRIKSPRIARRDDMTVPPDHLEMPDLIVPGGANEFEYIGRSYRFVKVNGVRCNLDVVENRVRAVPFVTDVACVARRSAIRGEHYDLYYTSDAPDADNAQLRAILNDILGGSPAPRSLHRVERIPRSALGKVQFSELRD